MEKEIIIKLNRESFSEVFEMDKQGNYFFSAAIKNAFIALMLSILFVAGMLLYMYLKGKGAIALVLPVSIFLCALAFYLQRVNIVQQWKMQVNQYLDEQDKVRFSKIILSDNTFTWIKDDKRVVEEWQNFKSIRIQETYIELQGRESYLIPKKSMLQEEYMEFKAIIAQKKAAENP